MLTEARERAEAFSERYRGRVAELDAAELAEAMQELAAIHDLGGRAGSYAMLSYSLDTADPARGALMQKARELSAAIETHLLFFDLEWNLVPDERAEELLAAPELALRRAPPAHAAPLPPAPALRAGGARAHRDERDRRLGLPAAVHRADLRARGAAAGPRRARFARGGPLAPPGPRPRAPPRGRRGGDRVAPPRPPHARLRLQHAAPGQVDQGPPARLPALARVAQPRQRGERRVGPGADRGGAGPLRPRAALVRR